MAAPSSTSVKEFLRTFVWAAPLTVLLWLWADREQVTSLPEVTIPVTVKSSDPKRVATLAAPTDRLVVAKLEGRRSRLEALREAITSSGGEGVVIDLQAVAGSVDPGEMRRSTVEVLNANPLFATYGVRVASAAPPELRIGVDEVVEVEAAVVADSVVPALDGPVIFEPRVVMVRGPRDRIQDLLPRTGTGQYQVTADIGGLAKSLLPGQHDLPTVPLRRVGTATSGIAITPDSVRASLAVRSAGVKYVIPSLPVFALSSGTFLDEYRAAFEPVIKNVTVSGPPEVIAALKQDKLPVRPKAVLEFSRDDLPTGVSRVRKLRFELPAGVTLAADEADREVTFTLQRRTADGIPPG
jgi:hypothetical protein